MEIKVFNNVPDIKVTINKSDDGSFAILLAEDKKNKLVNIEPGSVTKIGNREFIVLEHTEQGTAVIAKDFAKSMPFGSTGDYTTSDVRSYCNGEFYDEMAKTIGAPNIISHKVDLTADDGTGVESVEDFVSILTTAKYRRYRKFLDAMEKSWWTATRVTAEASGYTGYVCCVYSCGILSWGDCVWSCGVRPFLILDSSLLVE